MITLIINIFLGLIGLYLVLGLVFSLYFYAKAGVKIDAGMKGAPWHFKVIIFPGVILFWVVLLKKAMRSND